MATKKKAKVKAKPKPKKYNPLASPYSTQNSFNSAVKKTARSQIDPQLSEVDYQTGQAQSAHANRQKQMQGWYQAENDAARAGADQLSLANQGILNSLQGAGQDAQAGMAAALRQTQDAANSEATRLGGQARQVDPNLLMALGGYSGAGNMALGGDIAASNARASANVGITGTMGREAAEAEDRRYTGITDSLTDQRRSLFAQLPGLMEQARQNLGNTELARSGQAFQQDLARDEFGLSKKQYGLSVRQQEEVERQGRRGARQSNDQMRLARDQFGLSKAELREQKRATKRSEQQKDMELGISAENARTQRMQVEASAGGDKDLAEAKGKQFQAGVSIIQNAWKQTKNDVVYARDKQGFQTKDIDVKKTQDRINARMAGKFDQIFNSIMASTGMGPGTAYRVMMTSPNHGWAKHAAQKLDQLKQIRTAQALDRAKVGGNERANPVTSSRRASSRAPSVPVKVRKSAHPNRRNSAESRAKRAKKK